MGQTAIMGQTALFNDQLPSEGGTYAELVKLVSELAHEIRNPLSSIRLNMELLGEDVGSLGDDSAANQTARRAKAKIDLVRQECDRLQKLDDFLDFSRQEGIDPEPGNLNVELDQLLDFFQPRTDDAGVELVRYLIQNCPAVRIDRETFRSAILNLLINATQAMEEGGQLMVRTRAAGLGVMIELIDTGPGMSSETLARVFEAFYSTKQGGSGLGLPTARKIIEAHGGSIDIESAPGRGTKLAIWLPAPPRLPTEPAENKS